MNTKQILFTMIIAAFLFSCGTNKKDDDQKKPDEAGNTIQERNKKAVMASMEALNNKNIDLMLKDMAPDAVENFDGSIPPVKGRDSIIASLKSFFSAFPDLKGAQFNLVAEGNYVFAFAEWTATFSGDLMGIKATGKAVKYNDVDVFRFNDQGQVAEHRNVYPTNALLMQAGAKLPG